MNAALLYQLYGERRRCREYNHGTCAKSGLVSASGDAPAPWADFSPGKGEGWDGVSARRPAQWTVHQTLLWLDSVGVQREQRAI